ncbi:hypothetical protein JB92DRAFT_1770135 [Gautieria morchelliformis]|nr:hypothetical protein JB92DRAFT_1770135 [Gautieria morchelliformis]
MVTFCPIDSAYPKIWSRNAKRLNVMTVCILVLVSVIWSSLYAPAELQIRQIYGVNANVASRGVTYISIRFRLRSLDVTILFKNGSKLTVSFRGPNGRDCWSYTRDRAAYTSTHTLAGT